MMIYAHAAIAAYLIGCGIFFWNESDHRIPGWLFLGAAMSVLGLFREIRLSQERSQKKEQKP